MGVIGAGGGERSGQIWDRILKAEVTGLANRLKAEQASEKAKIT